MITLATWNICLRRSKKEVGQKSIPDSTELCALQERRAALDPEPPPPGRSCFARSSCSTSGDRAVHCSATAATEG